MNGCGVYVQRLALGVVRGSCSVVNPLPLVNLTNSRTAPTLLLRLFADSFSPRLQKSSRMQAVSFWAFGYFDAQNSLNLRSLSIVRLLSLPDTSIWDW
ncbi:hypothetical protein [Bacteroides faecichinchillae]|uniref:hypothetical protein n=1 Tax=Bacteroides faecichinchillae TaxID=871325 RepID=UPI001FE34262|nr:hypothetical protein [Bacteroides faecichinchillae]